MRHPVHTHDERENCARYSRIIISVVDVRKEVIGRKNVTYRSDVDIVREQIIIIVSVAINSVRNGRDRPKTPIWLPKRMKLKSLTPRIIPFQTSFFIP